MTSKTSGAIELYNSQSQEIVVPMPTSPSWLATEAAAVPRIRAKALQWVVYDQGSMAEADATAKALLMLRDKLETERKSVTGPLWEAKRRIDGWFKPVTDILDESARTLKHKIATFTLEQQRERDRLYAEAARAHELATAGVPGAHVQMTLALQATSSAVVEPPRGTSVREEWRAEIVDARMVPCAYHVIDEARIQAEARATPEHAQPHPIPGVRFVKVAITSMRR
jgi:hypothetical protein